jgi:hypothetical protein
LVSGPLCSRRRNVGAIDVASSVGRRRQLITQHPARIVSRSHPQTWVNKITADTVTTAIGKISAEMTRQAFDEGFEEVYEDGIVQMWQKLESDKTWDWDDTFNSFQVRGSSRRVRGMLGSGVAVFKPDWAGKWLSAGAIEGATEVFVGAITIPEGGDPGDIWKGMVNGVVSGAGTSAVHSWRHERDDRLAQQALSGPANINIDTSDIESDFPGNGAPPPYSGSGRRLSATTDDDALSHTTNGGGALSDSALTRTSASGPLDQDTFYVLTASNNSGRNSDAAANLGATGNLAPGRSINVSGNPAIGVTGTADTPRRTPGNRQPEAAGTPSRPVGSPWGPKVSMSGPGVVLTSESTTTNKSSQDSPGPTTTNENYLTSYSSSAAPPAQSQTPDVVTNRPQLSQESATAPAVATTSSATTGAASPPTSPETPVSSTTPTMPTLAGQGPGQSVRGRSRSACGHVACCRPALVVGDVRIRRPGDLAASAA